jgi:hypothetical protein
LPSDILNIRTHRDVFEELLPGSLFVTQFGIVKVIADDRFPKAKHQSQRARKDYIEKFDRRKHLHMSKQSAVAESMYNGGRKRREHIQKVYDSMRHPSCSLNHENELNNEPPAAQIWRMYSHSVTTHQILNERMSWRDVNGDPHNGFEIDSFNQRDPRFHEDNYPERIVECELVSDEREHVYSDNCKMQNASQTSTVAPPKMRLYLTRKLLTERYDSSSTKYVCSACGKSFFWNEDWERHVNEKSCSLELKSNQEKRTRIIEDREEDLDFEGDSTSFLSAMHAVMKPKTILDSEFGNPCKVSICYYPPAVRTNHYH